MMHTLYGVQMTEALPMPYPQDIMFDDISHQTTISQASRGLSRPTSQRPGMAMKVVKPSSANNSPRSSAMMARRKTLMNDETVQRRRQQALEQASAACYSVEQQQQQQPKSSRPSSWHPSSYGHLTQSQQPLYTLSSANMFVDQQDIYGSHAHLSPMMTANSCNTSPSTSFSPLALPYQTASNMQYISGEDMTMARPASMTYPSAGEDGTTYINGWDWNSFIMHGFSSTTPPTPETFPPSMTEESIPYQALDESTEEEGEILVGMGLYDKPEKYNEDPQLNNYRSTVSSLLGSSFRGNEPQGKGLKLEETWEPPKPEENDEEEEDEDEDEDEE